MAAAAAVNTPPETVVDVQISGNKAVPLEKILPNIKTRKGRPFDLEMIQEDVRRLDRTHMFVTVRTYYQQVAGGRIVIFDVLERPLLQEMKFVGCHEIRPKALARELEKECKLKVGDALDPYVIEEARRHLEEFYGTKGFNGARVTLIEGNKPEDRRAIFLINEGTKQRVWRCSLSATRSTATAGCRLKSRRTIRSYGSSRASWTASSSMRTSSG